MTGVLATAAALVVTIAIALIARRRRTTLQVSARSRRSLLRLVVIWLSAAVSGVGLALALGMVVWDSSPIVYFGLLAALPLGALATRSPALRYAASGAIFGFAGFVRIVFGEGPYSCDSLLLSMASCVPNVGGEWTIVLTAALILAVLLVAVPGRVDGVRGATRSASSRHRASGLAAGPELLREIERTLGVAVLVQSIDASSPASIDALLMLGQYSQQVTATGQTEAHAWRELALISVAWRSADDKQVPLWWGAGGV